MPDEHEHHHVQHIRIEGLAEFLNLGVEILRRVDKSQHFLEKLMSALTDFANEVKADSAAIGASVDGLVGDVKTLNDKIASLTGSPEEAALVEEVKAAGKALVDKTAALDAQTAPAEVPTPA